MPEPSNNNSSATCEKERYSKADRDLHMNQTAERAVREVFQMPAHQLSDEQSGCMQQ